MARSLPVAGHFRQVFCELDGCAGRGVLLASAMPSPSTNPELSALAPDRRELRPMATVMAAGIFATTFVQLQGLGVLPINSLLMKHMNLNSNEAGTFVALGTLPWTFKPVAGLLVDGVPLFGSRRRGYLLAAAVAAAVGWALMALASGSYWPFFMCALVMNTALVFASTASGGLLVEAGQRFNASGSLSSLRAIAQNLGAALGVPVGGYLAGRAFGWTSAAAIVPLGCMFVTTWFLLREKTHIPSPRGTERQKLFATLKRISGQIVNVLRPEMLAPAALLFFIQAVPTFRSTSFYEYQTKSLGFEDVTLGNLSLAGSVAGLLGPLCYAWLCRRLPLRVSLYGAIVATSLSALPYLDYPFWNEGRHLPLLIGIEAASSFLMYLAYVPLFDLAVRATPKGSEALGYSLLISVWNIGLMIGGKAGPWIYQNGIERALAAGGGKAADAAADFAIRHGQMNHLIWLNAGVTLAGLALVAILPARLVGRASAKA